MAQTPSNVTFIRQMHRARVRSTGWCHRKRRPSATSARTEVCGASEAPLRLSRRAQGQAEETGHDERHRVEGERQGRRAEEEERPERRCGEVGPDDLRSLHLGVGPAEAVGTDDRRQQGEGGGAGEGLAGAQQEQRDVEQVDVGPTQGDRQRQPSDDHRPAEVDEGDEPAPVEPVDVDPADQREEQPRQLLGEQRPGDEQRVVGQGGDEQGAGRRASRRRRRGDRVAQPEAAVVGQRGPHCASRPVALSLRWRVAPRGR